MAASQASPQQRQQSSFQCQYRGLFLFMCILALALYIPVLFDIHKRSLNNWMGGIVDFNEAFATSSATASGTRIGGKTTTNTKSKKKKDRQRKCNEPWLPNQNMINHTLLKQRMLPLSIKYNKFSYVHISKCAGASWIRELRDLLPAFKPYRDIGEEFSVVYQRKNMHQIWFDMGYQTYGDYLEKKPVKKPIPGKNYKKQQREQQEQLEEQLAAAYNNNNNNNNNIVMMTSFKHPRAHVWSLWGECAFDKIWKHPPIPYNPQSTYEKNFETWLNHFLQIITRPKSSTQVDYDDGFCLHDDDDDNNNSNTTTTTTISTASDEQQVDDDDNEEDDMVELYNFKTTDCFDCYHPANYQCRPFVAPIKQVYPHCVALLPNDQFKYTPNLDVVRRVRNEFAWISISEFFHESKCLLYHRLSKNINNNKSRATDIEDESITIVENTIHDYLDRFCRCPVDTEGIKNQTITVKHFQQGKRKSMLGLPTNLLKKIDFFVKQDIINYRESLVEFILSVVQMEKELDRRILCDTTISKWEPEFEYIGLYNDDDNHDDNDGDGGSKFRLSQIYEWAQNNI